jgi:hypothetical protein
MSNLHNLEQRLKAIQQLIAKLNNSPLSQDELEELVNGTRELYERSVILQYKAFEEKVFGQREIPQAIEVTSAPVEEMIADESIPVAEEQQEEQEQEEVPAFDFSLFDDAPEAEEVPVTNEPEVEEHFSASHTVTENDGVIEEQIVVQQVKTTVQGDLDPLVASFQREIQQMSGFSAPRLETLVGSFGLNERLQFINELFGGSSEAFADAIKELDLAQNLTEALRLSAGYAALNHWDQESETVHDYLAKLKRRYA